MKKTDLAKAITAFCFRNTDIENIHAGIAPVSNTGDFSDVFVVDAKRSKPDFTSRDERAYADGGKSSLCCFCRMKAIPNLKKLF